MIKSSVILISIFVLFTISEMSCTIIRDECSTLHDPCTRDSDCCSKTCGSPIYEDKFCVESKNSTLLNEFPGEERVESGVCYYKKPTTEEEISRANRLNSEYGFNVAHALLPEGTQLVIAYDHKKLLVTVNNFQTSTNGTVIELSREVAEFFKITESVNCTVRPFNESVDYNFIPPIVLLIFYMTSMFLATSG